MPEKCMLWTVLFVGALASVSHAARILAVIPMPAKSHHIMIQALLQDLVYRQHEVTVINFYPQEKPQVNYTNIPISLDIFGEIKRPNMFTENPSTYIGMLMKLWGFGNMFGERILSSPKVQELIHNKDEHFDLIIMEAFFSDAFLGFAHRFKAPIIAVCPYGGSFWMHNAVGNPSPFSYIPDAFLKYSDHMTFIERLHNTINGIVAFLGQELYFRPKQTAIMKKYFNNSGPLPTIHELESQTTLLLTNSHVSFSYPRPLVPNVVEVGGLHIKPSKKLPEDLLKYLNDAPDGVIYFSMGSNLQSSQLPEEKREALLRVFSKLKQKVMWKWETDELPGKPSNLLIRKWFPQTDILAHPNVKLFIIHGGLLSTMEAIYHGVPVLGIPVFGDQELNMATAELKGFGVGVHFKNLTSESLQWALSIMLDNPRYRENAQKLSRIFKDQPQTPMERAVYWVEYILRHKGAPHLRSAALELKWYQYFLLDVIAVLFVVSGLSVVVIYFSLRTLFKFLRTKLSRKYRTASNKKKDN